MDECEPHLPSSRSFRPIRNRICSFITFINLGFFLGRGGKGVEERNGEKWSYQLFLYFVLSSKKPPYTNEPFSLQLERGMMDKFCRQKHFSIIFWLWILPTKQKNVAITSRILRLCSISICYICLLCLRNKTISLFFPSEIYIYWSTALVWQPQNHTNMSPSLTLVYRGWIQSKVPS